MNPQECVGREVHTLDNKILKTLISVEADRGVDEVTVMHGWILGYIYDNQHREIFQKDIEAEFQIAKSTTTGILKLMEKKGYIIREPVERDARLKKIILTEKGKSLHEGTVQNLLRLENRIRKNVDAQDLQTFFQVVRQMQQNLSEKCC